MFSKFKSLYKEFPNTFKVLTLATFIDRLGGFLLFPFFSLYITDHFGVGMTEVGLLFSIFSAGNIVGGMIGGALADKYGRRIVALIGLVVSGIGSILMGLVNDLGLFFIIAAFLGTFGNFGSPARQAMVTDLLPTEKQAEGFGILRVAVNLSAVIGPLLGGVIATQSYMLLFIADAFSSIITAVIVFIVIPETKPQRQDDEPEETVMKSIIGYKEVLKDWVYVLFLSVSAITVLVYMQLNSTLSVFLRDVHGFPAQGFALLLSMNALMVVLFQFWISRKISKYDPMKMIALGTFFYMIGFGMYGFISEVYLFFIAMGILTVGEMIAMPTGQTAAASFAPKDKRGRYMAMYGFHWAIPNLFGVLLAGLILDNIGPNWVWYFAGILSFIAMIGFWLLHGVTKTRFSKEKELPIEEMSGIDQEISVK
ncbi:MAG: MFS transporter [Candidatus Lokiarchaeota archaeon]|nr:MFS transporter [Candidatus Lokiarchaeota archaeon]